MQDPFDWSRPDTAPSVLEARFEEPARLAESLAESIAEDLRLAIATRGEATLAVAGGRTPIALFESLARQPLAWPAVTITLTDERWVDPDHPASNEGLVRRHLLQGPAAAARLIGLKNPAPDPEEGWQLAEHVLTALSWPLDVVILGMGADGHTASLFPGSPALEIGLDAQAPYRCVPAPAPGSASPPRLSLTLRALLDSRRTVLMIIGEDKWHVYRRALRPGPVAELPIRAVLGYGREPIDVYWAP